MIGYNGTNLSNIFFHPNEVNKIVYPMGGLVVIENVNDKHEQTFLRGHDMNISALSLSPSGTSTSVHYHCPG